MAANISDVDVLLEENIVDRPFCSHGPTSLFVKYTVDGDSQQFYACSAFRDRKECNFFQRKDEKVSESKRTARETIKTEADQAYKKLKKRCHKLRKLKAIARVFCVTCGQFLLPKEKDDHSQHETKSSVDDDTIRSPSRLFRPLDNNKTYAQYLFSESTIQFTINVLKKLKISKVLCVGAPRIHEAIQSDRIKHSKLESLLLDLDYRYQQIYPPKKFCRYNMFNHYFFNDSTSEAVFSNFLTESDDKHIALVTDPPFGGLVEVLASTFKKITETWKKQRDTIEDKELPVLWFFPYFMEKRIVDCLPQYSMLDYKVDYDNHALFRGDVKKYGSPVRIFTNIPPSQIELPSSEGYWYCSECKRYSGPENVHCQMCDSCTSKDGRTYRHCFKCDRCIKPSKVHCEKCGICQLKDHKCGQIIGRGCHICGNLSHKRKDCPNKGKPIKRKKFKQDGRPIKKKKFSK
ncbi:rRNA N6-adenosine-methyltransferase ZCCHC4-like [Mytilus californianus]|uniref:rRNA N6-adenosine-methyltransferase ZCCHC4-like n=1 Tax=Mytilus californianus TaxID=6549 RepID=UPI002247E880|nr:rRNA N6-adenosine-methyltransferase ZCCHC4-like [Mytilus californianus]